MKCIYLWFCLLALASPSFADVSCPKNVEFDSEIEIETHAAGTVPLSLNGVGLRKVFFVNVFYGAFYLETPTSNENDILVSDDIKVLVIHALRRLPKENLEDEWTREYKRLCKDRCGELHRFHKQFLSYGRDAQKNERLVMIFTRTGVELLTEDGADYAPIESREYGDILLSSLIGPRPGNRSFKESVLGRGKKICQEI